MSEDIDKYKQLNFFYKIKSNIISEKPKFVQKRIKEHRKNIKIIYEKEPNFVDIMPKIKKEAENNDIYKYLIKNSVKYNTKLIKLINKTIKKIKEKSKPKKKIEENKNKIDLYKYPKIDKLKEKKVKFEKENTKKIKLIRLKTKKFEDYKSFFRKKLTFNKTIDEVKKQGNIRNMLFLNSGPKNLKGTLSLNFEQEKRKIPNMRNNISFNRQFSLSPSRTRISTESRKDLSLNYSKKNESNPNISFINERENNSFIIPNTLTPLDIIQKCNEEEKNGYYINNSLNQYKNYFNKSMNERIPKNKFLGIERMVLLEKMKRNNKYKKLEEKKIRNIKALLTKKISDNWAYVNRKELREVLKMKEPSEYNFYLDEVKKTNKKIFKELENGRNEVDKIIFRYNEELRKNELYKKKLGEIKNKNRKLKNRINASMELPEDEKLFNDDDEYLIKENLFHSFNKSQEYL